MAEPRFFVLKSIETKEIIKWGMEFPEDTIVWSPGDVWPQRYNSVARAEEMIFRGRGIDVEPYYYSNDDSYLVNHDSDRSLQSFEGALKSLIEVTKLEEKVQDKISTGKIRFFIDSLALYLGAAAGSYSLTLQRLAEGQEVDLEKFDLVTTQWTKEVFNQIINIKSYLESIE